MIDEAIGKILGMAMAYAVSGLGLLLAYVNYRRRTLRAARVLTPRAWGVIAIVALVVAGGVAVVASLAQPPQPRPAVATEVDPAPAPPVTGAPTPTPEERPRWPLVGLLLPAAIFIGATWVTGWLYLHFTRGDAAGAATRSSRPLE